MVLARFIWFQVVLVRFSSFFTLVSTISRSFVLSLKYDHHFLLCEFPILFSTVKLKLGHNFSQFIHRFKIWILKYWSWAVYICFHVFLISLKRWKIEIFEKARMHLQICPNQLKCLKIGIFEVPLPSCFCQMVRIVFQYDTRRKRRNQFMIKLPVFKQKC